MKKIISMTCATLTLILLVFTSSSFALSVLGTTQTYGNYGYNGSYWTNMTATLNSATDNNFDTTGTFDDYANMLSYDAIWLDLHEKSDLLSATERDNINAFIATGRRVVMIGENSSWAQWDTQILGLVGGTASINFSGETPTTIPHELTNGVSTVSVPTGGTAIGGTALFEDNFATLWGNNVLTVLDVNIFTDSYWNSENNGLFATNVANWIADSSAPVPEPATFILLGSGLAGLAFYRRKRK